MFYMENMPLLDVHFSTESQLSTQRIDLSYKEGSHYFN